jgi:GNAT superfamily N-acetyltransferase
VTEPQPSTPRLVDLADADGLAVAADVLTAAFTGDPVMHWLFPGAASHVRSLHTWWELMLSLQRADAEVWLSPTSSTAALWRAPVFEAPDPDPAARERFVEVVAGLVGDRAEEVFGFFGRIGEAHPAQPHWYLAAVGSMPEHQGTGAGAAILAPVLAHCDAGGLPAYLESSNPRNVPFYHRLGFVETGTLTTPDGAATMTLMWRTPR